MAKKILIVLGILLFIVLGFAGIVALQPPEYEVIRRTVIEGPSETVYAQVSDFRKWQAWSPWEKLDPDMKRTFEGPESGEGAIYSWSGNDKVGEGRMTILESKPNKLVRIKLEFLKPMTATSTTDFVFSGMGNRTQLMWNMYGNKDFMTKAMCMFMSMDQMVGPDFEKGLAALKEVVEKAPPPPKEEKGKK